VTQKLPSRQEIEDLAASLPPPRIIRGLDGSAYLSRYYLTDRPTMPDGSEPFDEHGDPRPGVQWVTTSGVYLHRFHRGDDDRELHCHPFRWSVSTILVGGYREERRLVERDLFGGDAHCYEIVERVLRPGDVNLIAADDYHRVDLLDGEAWTIFAVGPRVASWSFWDRRTGAVTEWREFLERKRAEMATT
jgi:hypothetical protein